MTIAACFKIAGTPVLFADTLVSTIGHSGSHGKVPTVADPSRILPEEWLRLAKGVRKKTLQIGDEFLIAGAGNVLAMRLAFKELRCAEASVLGDANSLGQLFNSLKLDSLDLALCGWFQNSVTGLLESFHWEKGGALSVGNKYSIGSGNLEFEKELAQHIDKVDVETADPVSGRLRAIETAGHLVGQQQFTGFGLASLFGGGIEVYTFEDGRFERIENLLHVHWFARGLKLDLPPRFMLHQYYVDDSLVLNSIWPQPKGDARQEYAAATPVYSNRVIEINPDATPEPHIFVNFCMTLFEQPNYGYIVGAMNDPDHNVMRLEMTRNGAGLNFHGKRLAEMLRGPMEELQELGARMSSETR